MSSMTATLFSSGLDTFDVGATAMDMSDDVGLLSGSGRFGVMPYGVAGNAASWSAMGGSVEFTTVSGDDTSANIPQTAPIMATQTENDEQMDLKVGHILFANCSDKSPVDRQVVWTLPAVNSALRRAARASQADQQLDALDAALNRAGGVGQGNVAAKRVMGRAIGTGTEYTLTENDRLAVTVRDAVKKWSLLGAMISDKTVTGSSERLVAFSWGGPVRIPYIVPNPHRGDYLGIEYYLDTEPLNRNVYTSRGAVISGQTISQAVQIRLVNLGARRAAPQFVSGGAGGAVRNTLSRTVMRLVEAPATTTGGIPDYSLLAAETIARSVTKSAAATNVVKMYDAPLETSITVPFGYVASVKGVDPGAEQMAMAHLTNEDWELVAARQTITVTAYSAPSLRF